jgi:hypothetical protein
MPASAFPRSLLRRGGVLALLLVACAPWAGEPQLPRTPRDVFIFAGQSNMAGADAALPPEFAWTEADRRTLYAGAPLPSGARAPNYCAWDRLKGHLVGRPPSGERRVTGPETGFARRLDEGGISNIAIVAAWANFPRTAEQWPWRESGELNQAWLSFVDERLAELRGRGFEPRVRGFVWHQGIDDAIHGRLAASCQENLTSLIKFLRHRFNAPDAAFLLARSVDSPIAKRVTGVGPDAAMAMVRRAQVAVGETVTNAAWINVDDLPNVAQHHFSADSQLVIGRRFGDAYLRLAAPVQRRALRHGRILAHPATQPEGTTRPVSYEVGALFQLDREHCLLTASLREQGGHDFEVGNDGFVFQRLSEILAEKAIPINRLDTNFQLKSARGRCVLGKFPVSGAFVPRGARLEDGSPHPGAGTGFLVSGSLPFLPDRSDGHPEAGPDDRPFDLVQLRWDGHVLQVARRDQVSSLVGRRLGRICLSNFCAQDRGFLCPFGPDDGSFVVVIRFDWDGQSWKPTAAGKPFITAKAPAGLDGKPRVYRYLEVEPCIVHVQDHYLVHTRGRDPKGRVYISEDGLNYQLLFEHPNHTVPQVLNQGLDGSLYLATNPGPGWLRNPLLAYALRGQDFVEPLIIHDEQHIRGDKGKEVPFCDHCRGANVFLEGRWRHLLLYRVCDMSETDGRGAAPFPQTGLYLAEFEYEKANCLPFNF